MTQKWIPLVSKASLWYPFLLLIHLSPLVENHPQILLVSALTARLWSSHQIIGLGTRGRWE